MKIYVVGSSENNFLPLDNIREKFLIDQPHDGDNIDSLNPWYCELTGLYYLWKHVDDEIVGLEHYRRYFVNNEENLLSENEIREILKDYDMIGFIAKPTKTTLLENIQHIANIPNKTNYDLTPVFKKIIFTACYYEKFTLKDALTILQQHTHYRCNMFICKKEIINEYCFWLYDIMSEIHNTFDIKKFELRSIGYVVEILLFPLWLKITNKKMYANKVKIVC